MKLRVRIGRRTIRVELPGGEPSLKELIDHIKDTVLSSHGLSAETEFSLSLNGSELLADSGQTLSSCGIVSGDLICVILPESAAATAAASAAAEAQRTEQNPQDAAGTSNQPSDPAAVTAAELEEAAEASDSEPSASSWEPMLCSEAEEGQAPLSLELLYHSAQTASPSDAVMVAGNLLMLETGFVPQGCEMKAGEMPAGWRSAAGVYKLQYTHPLCDNSLAMVVAVCMGPVLVINATLKVNQTVDAVRKLCLNPSSYVTDEWPGESAAAAFKDLSKLSRIFKDQLAYPLIAAAREAMALPVAFGLAALPPELLLRVLRLLDVSSVLTLSSVCRYFNTSTADSSLWRHLYRRDFTDSDPSRPRDTDWKELYKRSQKLRCMRRRARPILHPPLHPNPLDFFFPVPIPAPPYPPLPGIIGGEYDQRPALPHGLLPRPRYDPIGPPRPHDFRRVRPTGGRPADVRRGFI
ncbi:F-box only protein 7 isoform X2 [Dicentrarchus labrax]|uniref:F-box only protein 7 isoform X2 n=1 Tax=Dicentrarchus labrax TaxID=13489 RepID=UPI0021F581B7|nr:F-box only protein 7 isoform X2 [Dicentrarchus labrax]